MARYLDGDLSLDVRALFDAHLDQCVDCSQELSEMRDTIRLLRGLPSEEPPANFVSDVMARITEGEGQPSLWNRVADQLSEVLTPRFAVPISAVAAGLTLAVMSGDLSLESLNFEPRSGGPEVAGVTFDTRTETANPAGPSISRVPFRAPDSGSTRVATVTAETRARQVGRARAANELRNTLFAGTNSQGGAGSYLARVASERPNAGSLGPIRRMPSESDVASRILFVSGGPSSRPGPYLGPYLGASAAPTIALGSTNFFVSSSAGDRGVTPVAVSRLNPNAVQGDIKLSPDELRNRELDARLRFLEVDPPGFAEQHAQAVLAEQELWMREMAIRAEELGDVDRVLSALQGSGDDEALGLAQAFESAVKRNRDTWAANEAPQASE
jgi:hypothetical protein